MARPARRLTATADALMRPGEHIETRRLGLTLATPADIEAMPWLEAALAQDWRVGDLLPHAEAARALLISKDERPIGVTVGTATHAAALIPFIAIEPSERYRGLGGEAALAVETLLRVRGAELVLAPVPEQRGLAVYFWLRLGFRPLLQVEAPSEPVGLDGKLLRGIWMARGGP
ncbi:MAG TPA: hypothetical protein VH951_13165 [Dehalococcoidia bacterium]